MSDIIREVQEDLRAERMQRLLTRFGGVLAAALLVVVAGVAGLQGYRWWDARESARAAERYLAAAAPGAPGAVADRFAGVAAEAPVGYRTLALLREAGLRAAAGEVPTALGLWDRLARDGGADPLYRQLATLLWALHALDTGDAGAIEARVAPLADAEGPWRAAAREVRGLAALKRGDVAAARTALGALADDPTQLQGVRDRAARLLSGVSG